MCGLTEFKTYYYPEIIVGEAARAKASAFKHPDPQWRERLDEIQQAHASRSASRAERPLNAFRVARNRASGKNSARIPEVHTSNATENSVTLEEIENVEGFVKNLERIELPNQLIAVLGDPLLQKLLLLKPHAEAHQRASNWLASYGQDLLSGDSSEDINGSLELLETYVSSTRPLEAKVLDNTINSQLELLGFYTTLLQRWTISLASLEQKSAQAPSILADLVTHVNDLCLTLVQTAPTASTHSRILDFYEQTAVLASDPKLLVHTRISIPASPLVYILHFGLSPANLSRLCAILSKYKEGFQKAMTTSRSEYTPTYINEFNGFLMDICNCLWRSRAFNSNDVNAHGCLVPKSITEDLTSYVTSLNMGGSLTTLFSISYSPILGLFAISYFRELENEELERSAGGLRTRHAGPVTRHSLVALANNGGLRVGWDDYRLGVLTYLEQKSMTGVGQLMYNTMTNVMRRRSSMMMTDSA
ncbi:hypothetical protein AAE478_004714 [Parahypoxylon ruwenzoriense]